MVFDNIASTSSDAVSVSGDSVVEQFKQLLDLQRQVTCRARRVVPDTCALQTSDANKTAWPQIYIYILYR